MTANIVHWKDVVGKDFLDEFMKITRAIIAANSNNQIADVVIGKLDPDVAEKYRTKRALLQRCGYEENGRQGFSWLGWYCAYLDKGNLRFKTTAPPDRSYITMNAFLEFKLGKVADREELDYSGGIRSVTRRLEEGTDFEHEE